MKRTLAIISQVCFGLAFIFSGIVKCIDPIGTSIKLHDYFGVFDLAWLNDWTLLFAWVLSLLEFIIGLNILFARNLRLVKPVATLFMSVFTLLTLYLAIANPVSDCGCFGDAVVLTNWQTFWKNIVLDFFLLFLWLFHDKCYQISRTDFVPILFYWELAIAAVLCFIGSNLLPVIDFRPFRPGVNIPVAMSVAGEETAGDVQYVCVYEKDGEKKEFPLEELPSDDSGWVFVETKEIASSTGAVIDAKEPLIKDFFLFDESGSDMTEVVLNDPNYTFLLVSPSLATAKETYIDRIENLYEYCVSEGYNFYCLTINDSVQVNGWKYRTGAEYEYLYSDATILETMIRSNPGVVLLKEGTILWKSSLHQLDADTITSAKLSEQTYGQIIDDNRNSKVFWIVILMLLPFVVYLPIEKAFQAYKKSKAKKASRQKG